jgi:lambda family phage portal protein
MRERPRAMTAAPRPTLLDRAIAVVAPGVAAERVAHRWRLQAMQSGYEAGRGDRAALRGWMPLPRTADADALYDLPRIRARTRDLDMNAPIARGAVRTVCTNVVGAGLTLDSQADRKPLLAAGLGLTEDVITAAEEAIEREWRLFTAGQTADALRRLTWPQMEELALLSHLRDGDVFAAFVRAPAAGPFDLAVQLIEADAVCNPDRQANGERLADGIEYDEAKVWQAIHVAEIPRMGTGGPRGWARLPVRAADGAPRVLHIMRPDRIGQSRGVPYLAPVIKALRELETYTEAELRAAVMNACIAILGQTEDGSSPLKAEAAGANQGGLRRADVEFTPGMMIEGFMPGEKLEGFGAERPATGFDPFVQAILRQIGVALEIPFEVLIKHFTASYSAARAALLEAWKMFRARRSWLAAAFHQPVFEAVVRNAVLRGRLDLPGFADPALRDAWMQTAWTGPSPGQINPEAEISAAEKRLALRLTTRAEEKAALDGGHWESTLPQIAKEEGLLRDAALPPPGPPAAPALAAARRALPGAPQQADQADQPETQP